MLTAQQDSVKAGVYEWQSPIKEVQDNIRSAVLFEGSTRDMEWLQMNAMALSASAKANKLHVPINEEHLYIVKKGLLTIELNDSVYTLTPGSIALLLPEEQFSIQAENRGACEYYVMKYRSREPIDLHKGKVSGGSFIKDWNKISFSPHDKGGIRRYFERPTAMMKRMEMHVSTLNAGLKSHDPHAHRAAEIVLMIEGDTEMQIGEGVYKGKPGSVYYLSSNILHAIRNIGAAPATYFAFQFE